MAEAMIAYHAKKRFGQNFLESDSIVREIIEIVEPDRSDHIIEIGPGRGSLTGKLADSGAQVLAVEFDRDLISSLKRNLSAYPNVEILNTDFLNYEPDWDTLKLVGNLPYNITSPAIAWTIRHRKRISRAVFMVQKEVAQRLASTPRNKDWSPLAIFTQLHYKVRICFDVAPEHFNPSPKVTSAVILLTRIDSVEITDPEMFETVVRAAFHQRRKLLLNNLVPSLINERRAAVELLSGLGLGENCRAEELSIDQFLQLTEALGSHNIS